MEDKVAELEALRKEVMERLVTAREMGDLSENGAYKYAKFELGSIGRQLKRFRGLLENGFPVIQTKGLPSGSVDFGSWVTVQKNDGSNKELKFCIVSKHESEPVAQKIAYSSPMGKAVMRKKAGEVITVATPAGDVSYTILAVA